MKYKPDQYNSLSPYFVVDGAEKYMELLARIFEGEMLRQYHGPDGRIVHAEMRIDDSVLMFGNSNEAYPPNELILHLYVPDVDQIYQRALEYGCEPIQEPRVQFGDPDKRGSFRDPFGHFWSVATQIEDKHG